MSNGSSATATRQVDATFGVHPVHEDPAWEREMAAHLKSTTTSDNLAHMFAEFRMGERPFDYLMRRVVLHALCRRVGHDLQVGPGVVLKHPETMEFGDCVFIGPQTMIQGRFDGRCKFGNHVWIGPQSYFDARDLVVEDYVGWGPGAKILGSTHTGLPLDQPVIATALTIRPVRVCFGADVGMNASLLPGVTLGPNSIVGAGAVVSADVPEYAIVAGVPARFLRDRRDVR